MKRQPKLDDAVALMVIMLAVPAGAMIAAVLVMILKAWGRGLGS